MLCGLPRFQASMMMDSVALLSAAYPSNGGQGPGAGMAMLQQQQQQAQLQYATTSSSLLASPDSPLLDGNGQAESKTNLIINYLPQTMSQEEVRSLFASLGDIDSCKLVRDKLTGQSLGYGFVNYVKAEDAIKAVGTLNGLRLQNKTIKVSHARPSSESIKGANLYVSGLPKSMGQSELEGLFKSFGHIITSRILSDNVTGLSKGVGFVRFDTKEQAEQAIAQLNGSIPIGCCEAITVSQQAAALMPLALLNTAATNYVAAAAAAAAAGGRRLVPSSGPIHHTSQAARFRYSPLASMPTASAGNQADFLTTTALLQMAAASGGSPSTPLVTALSGGSPPSSNGWCIFVYNLAPEMEDAILWQLFGPFGAVLSVKVIRDFASGKCKGYGFVMMAQYEEALSAITALHGTQLGNRTLQVSFKSANQSALLRVQ